MCPCIALRETLSPSFIFTSWPGPGPFETQPAAEFSLPHNTLVYNWPSGLLGISGVQLWANVHLVVLKRGHACGLCTSEPLKTQSFHISAISHWPPAQFSPAVLWDGQIYPRMIPVALPLSVASLQHITMTPGNIHLHIIISAVLHIRKACQQYTHLLSVHKGQSASS